MGDWLTNTIEALKDFVWGPAMMVLLLGAGLFFTVGGRFIQVTKWPEIWRQTFGGLLRGKAEKKGGVTPFQAVSTALASTVGTGNIVGVAAAMALGGPGAIFWMWVSAFLGMMTKYAEVVLAQIYRRPDGHGGYIGGPMYVIRDGLHNKLLAGIFAVFGLLASFGVGNMIQVVAIVKTVGPMTNLPNQTIGLATMLITGAVILGGAKVIIKVTEKLTPFMAGLYILAALMIILLNTKNLPQAFGLIFKDAFKPIPAVAGIGGFLLTNTLREGLACGMFSHEAGMGSSAIAHASANVDDPVKQGFWGTMEVFIDTIVMCTLTALAILTSGVYIRSVPGAGDTPNLALFAFTKTFGSTGGLVLGISTALFAIGAIIGWQFYGEACCRYLFPRSEKRIAFGYRLFYIAAVFVGSTQTLDLLWNLCKALNGLMAIPNLIALFLLSGVLFKATKRYFEKEKMSRK